MSHAQGSRKCLNCHKALKENERNGSAFCHESCVFEHAEKNKLTAQGETMNDKLKVEYADWEERQHAKTGYLPATYETADWWNKKINEQLSRFRDEIVGKKKAYHVRLEDIDAVSEAWQLPK